MKITRDSFISDTAARYPDIAATIIDYIGNTRFDLFSIEVAEAYETHPERVGKYEFCTQVNIRVASKPDVFETIRDVYFKDATGTTTHKRTEVFPYQEMKWVGEK